MQKDLVEVKKINKALQSLDSMARAIVELSYKIKTKLLDGKLENLSTELLRDILVLREAQEKNLDEIHEELSESMNAQDLYSMLS